MKPELTKQDLQNILACLANAEVKGVQASAALVVLHNKVQQILQAEEANGNGNGADSTQPGADKPAATDDHVDAAH
jgi:hypothetical protein